MDRLLHLLLPAHRRRPDRQEAADEGMAMIMCMVFIIIGMLVVTPLLSYAGSVLRSSRIQTAKTDRAEAVRGALRVALADPRSLYDACSNSGLTVEVELAAPGLDVPLRTVCTTVNSAAELDATELRTAMTLTQVGATAPVGTVGSVFAGSGGDDISAWYSGATADSTGGAVWLPLLPVHALNHPAINGYMMPSGFGSCRVFFPGTYSSPVSITDSVPTYFASGVYYFESSVTFGGAANVVVGEGAVEGCTDDQEAAYNAVNAPTNHNISGLGATFILGAAGRLVVTDSGSGTSGPRVQFNTRLVDPTDVGSLPSKNVSIMTVNGQYLGDGDSGELNLSGLVGVPRSSLATASSGSTDPVSGDYMPSTLIPVQAPGTTTAVIDISLTTSKASTVFVPGYVAVPQGHINITVGASLGAGKDVQLVGAVLAAKVNQTVDQPTTLSLGMINRIVQKTFKLVSTTTSGTPSVTSVALVQVNDYGEFAVNSWVTSSAGSGT
jgi:hypothetical protein